LEAELRPEAGALAAPDHDADAARLGRGRPRRARRTGAGLGEPPAGCRDPDVPGSRPRAVRAVARGGRRGRRVRCRGGSRVAELMRAAVLPAAGQPLQLERIRVPRPRRGEVLVRVAACGVCHTDLHVIKGEVAFPSPAVLGHEISGTVAELGEGVEAPAVGARIVGTFVLPCGECDACRRGRDDLYGPFFTMNRLRGTLFDGETRLAREDGTPLAMYSMGGLAEYAVLPATAVFPLPDSQPLEESAIVGCAALTAYGAVRHAASVRVGERVVVVATGGVGSLVLQLARAAGAAQMVAVDVGEAKLDGALRLGATHVVDASAGDPVETVLGLTDGGGDAVFEV